MNISDESQLTDFLGEHPRFFSASETTAQEVHRLVQIIEPHWWINNPYWVPVAALWGTGNIPWVVDYISWIFPSGKKPIQQLKNWVREGIEKRLVATLKSNWNALEWYMLEMLIKTQTSEERKFLRPSLELDLDYATDLTCIDPRWFTAWGKSLGIQITVAGWITPARAETKKDGLKKKRKQVHKVYESLKAPDNNAVLKKFWDKRPNIMSLLWVYGKLGQIWRQNGGTMFCRNLGLCETSLEKPFNYSVVNEAKDIADFIKISIETWNIFYLKRSKYTNTQGMQMPWREWEYRLEWKYSPLNKITEFRLSRDEQLISQFEILDTE